MVPGTVLDRLFLMIITVLHQSFNIIELSQGTEDVLARLCLIGACLSKIVLKFVFQNFQAEFVSWIVAIEAKNPI